MAGTKCVGHFLSAFQTRLHAYICSMRCMKWVMSFLCIAFCYQLQAQALQFDKLKLPQAPQGWSKQITPTQLSYSNMNVRGSTPFTVILFKGEAYSGKQDAAFASQWRSWLNLSDTAAVPKFRKMYNASSAPMASGGIETDGPLGKGYYLLTIYQCTGYLQAVGIFTASQKAFRTEFYDWNIYLTDAVCL